MYSDYILTFAIMQSFPKATVDKLHSDHNFTAVLNTGFLAIYLDVVLLPMPKSGVSEQR